MKKIFTVILSFVLCFTLIFSTSAPIFANNTTIKVPEEFQSDFDKLTNIVIDVVHRILMIFRYPWEPETQNKVDMSKFTLVFEDEFNGDELNKEIWQPHSSGERKGGFWDSEQTFIRDGNLVIRTEYKENGQYGSGYYCDSVYTRKKYTQTYGYFECRCILPAAKGLWSAFWLSNENASVDGLPGTSGTEIDVFESPLYYRKYFGLDNSMITSNLHWGGYGWQTKYQNVAISKAINPYAEFNTYGLEWNENEYIFYINGVEIGRSSAGGVSKEPEYMILSCEVDGLDGTPFYGWSGVITDNKNGELPAEFIVDYVRAYQYNDKA